MKINVWFIIVEHINTLSSRRPNGLQCRSVLDMLIFYGLPIVLGLGAWWSGIIAKDQVYSLSVSVFAIFSALLLSVQVAMYGVFKADRKSLGDTVLDAEAQQSADELRGLLREVNTNISYLILLSCLSVSVFLLFYAVQLSPRAETGVLITIYTHFILTLAMVLKRAHLVFDSEYRQ